MKKTLSLLAVFAIAGMMSAPAQAADHYISGMAGMSWFQDLTGEEVYDYEKRDGGKFEFDSGLTLAGAIGCDYGSTRLEAEIGYQANDVKDVLEINNDVTSSEGFNLDGDVSVLSLMANGFYDIDLGGVELYAMAGVGVAQVSFDDVAYAYQEEDFVSSVKYNASETTLAYQLGAGLAIPVADGVMIDARYRYFATTDFTMGDDGAFPGRGDDDYTGNLSSHSALLGLRVSL